MFENFTKEAQDQSTKSWKDPIAHTVVATALYIIVDGDNLEFQDKYHFYVAKRVKGACRGYMQAHHGGHVKVTDKDLVAAAIREVKEETGFNLKRHQIDLVSIFGPELNRSIMVFNEGRFELTILDIQAEPSAPFICNLFMADATGLARSADTDDEVAAGEFLSLREIIDRFGNSLEFNSFSMLFQCIKKLKGTSDQFPETIPGKYGI
jgi:8-oxo-dGTP pyrophosphatase MutT (NUDIX family)